MAALLETACENWWWLTQPITDFKIDHCWYCIVTKYSIGMYVIDLICVEDAAEKG